MSETSAEATKAPARTGPSGFVRLSVYISMAILGVAGLYFIGVDDACLCGHTAIDFGWAAGIFLASILATFASIEINITNGRKPGTGLVVAFVGLLFSLTFAIAVTLADAPHQDHRTTGHPGTDSRALKVW